MTEVDIYANKLKFKLKLAIVKLNLNKPINLSSSTRLTITPLTKGLTKSCSQSLSPYKRKKQAGALINPKNIRLKFNNSANINLGKVTKPNMKLFSIKKNSQHYNNNRELPLTKSNTISLTSFVNTNDSIFRKPKSFSNLEELPPINKILKTPLKLSKSPVKNFTPSSLNVAKSLLSLGGYY